MTFKFPVSVLAQHTAVLGKTGSGKTSTAKLMIEQVVADGSRVCILDPIKSDWWGLTSSKDGKRAGQPFVILGGPHGHVPLHSSAGKAIGDVVASGSLPLSIIDMADFEAGGLQRFFVDFAETIFKRNRGVLYLVIEEAHEFAPKERSGIGAENMSIHWAKKLATGTRTKGIRLIVATQRTQALHNAMIGSCDTVIAHRMTAPADQEPVIKWMKANAGKEAATQVADTLSNIRTGSGWLASGEAKLFELVEFPRIQTYDNTATPTGDGALNEVKTAPVDADKLRSIIGDAVKAAEANDPTALKKRIAELERVQITAPKSIPADAEALERAHASGVDFGARQGYEAAMAAMRDPVDALDRAVTEFTRAMQIVSTTRDAMISTTKFDGASPENPVRRVSNTTAPQVTDTVPAPTRARQIDGGAPSSEVGAGGNLFYAKPILIRGSIGNGARRRVMTAMAQNPEGITGRKIAILSGVKEGGSTWRAAMAGLRKDNHLLEDGPIYRLNAAGLHALGSYEPLPTGRELLEYWRSQFRGTRLAMFDAILAGRGAAVPAATVASKSGVELGGSTWRAHMAKLRGLDLVTGSESITPSEDLFS